MGWFSRVCSCCDRSVALGSDDTERSYVRVVRANEGQRSISHSQPTRITPRWRDSTRASAFAGLGEKSEYTQPLISIDEKEIEVGDCDSSPPTPDSSAVSIASTRVTALGSSYTGSSNAQSDPQDDTPPPSYHSGDAFPSRPASWGSLHPVLNNDWLERLQRAALEER